MTITPQHAKIIQALVAAHRDWVDAVSLGNDMETNTALRAMKQSLDDFRVSCPECGHSMKTTQQRRRGISGYTRTHLYCCQCRTIVVISTPPSHE